MKTPATNVVGVFVLFQFLFVPLLSFSPQKPNCMTTKKVLAVAFIAALSGVAVYTYVQKQKKAKRKNLPMNFI